MRKFKRNKRRFTFFDIILWIVFIGIVCSLVFIYYFNKVLGPGLVDCAHDEMERLTVLVMNNSFEKYLREHSLDDLLVISRNNNNQIELIQYNTKVMNEITSDIVAILEKDLYYLTKGEFEKLEFNLKNVTSDYYEMFNDGILFTVSVGSVTGNRLLANIGPKIPLNLSVIGEVLAQLDTKVTEYGLNNALIEVFVDLEVNMVIHMPFLSKDIKVNNQVPLIMEIIQGKVPSYSYVN